MIELSVKPQVRAKMRMVVSAMLCAVSLSVVGRPPVTGYRGFVEWSGDLWPDISLYGDGMSRFYTGITTTHGCQMSPWLFIGGGAGMMFWPKYDNVWSLPIFADARIDVGRRLFSPYLDVRLGANALRGGGLYFSPSVGLGVRLSNGLGVNVGIGYSLTGRRQDYQYVTYDDHTLNRYEWVEVPRARYEGCIAFRIGFEF